MKRLILLGLIMFVGTEVGVNILLSADSNFTKEDINSSDFNISNKVEKKLYPFVSKEEKSISAHACVASVLSDDSKFSSADTSNSSDSNLSKRKDKVIFDDMISEPYIVPTLNNFK